MEKKSDSIFVRISNDYYSFTVSEKKVADYVMSNKVKAQYMSISELADACDVAEATISRFCRRLNLSGYSGFKLALAKAEAAEERKYYTGHEQGPDGINEDDSVEELGKKLYSIDTAAIGQSLSFMDPDAVNEAADILWNAHKVYCMGQGGSMLLAMEAAHLFSTVSSGRFFPVGDSHLQASAASLLTGEDAVLFFSYSGSTKEVVELVDLARSKGAKVILITRFLRSPGAEESDVVLQCGSDEGPLQLGSVPARMAQLFVVDVLYHEYIMRDPVQARQCQERIAEALSQKHL